MDATSKSKGEICFKKKSRKNGNQTGKTTEASKLPALLCLGAMVGNMTVSSFH